MKTKVRYPFVYVSVSEFNRRELEEIVRKMLRDGWQRFGGKPYRDWLYDEDGYVNKSSRIHQTMRKRLS